MLRRFLGFTVAGLVLATAPACAQSSEIDALRREIADLREDLASLRSSLGRSRAIVNLDGGHQKGNPDALIALIEFSDYQCPFCARHTRETMPLIEKDFIATGRVLYGFRDFPIDQLHPQAIRAHEAAQCAGDQQKYWEMHARMFGDPSQHTQAGLESTAAEIGLNLGAFRACLAAGTHTAGIRADVALAESFGANGTPAFFIGVIDKATNSVRISRAITGAVPYAQFAQALEAAIAQAQKQP